ncbi:hypothetical protein [Streptomyces sp. R35]|uniref:SGNH hydrolase-type esterase domain-containing protein n=1 Tax=Streptomyces sp. R35 TaxID=3238630 RepID=A0AB39RZE2_9ACTN
MSIGQNSDSNDKKETPKGPYVALGDSYTSGPKIPPQTGNPVGCDRSGRNYPALVAKELGLKAADFRDVSCSGATITNFTTPQSTDKAPCKEKCTSDGTDAVAQKIRATGDRLTRALTEIERRAPEAQVYVVG